MATIFSQEHFDWKFGRPWCLAMASSVIAVRLADGRNVKLDVGACKTFVDVKALLHSSHGITYPFFLTNTPTSNVVSDSDDVKKVLEICRVFNMSIDHWGHVDVDVKMCMSYDDDMTWTLDLHRIESLNHLRRAVREKMGWDDNKCFDIFYWNGGMRTLIGTYDQSVCGGSVKLPWMLYMGNYTLEVSPAMALEVPVVSSETEISNDAGEDDTSQREPPPSDGKTNIKLETWSLDDGYSFQDMEVYEITYLDGKPHVLTNYNIYMVDEQWVKRHTVLIHPDDEESETIDSGDEDDATVIDTETVGGDEREPEDEPTGAHLTFVIADRRSATTHMHNIASSPNVSLANLRDRIVGDVLGLSLNHRKSMTFTRTRGDEVITNFRVQVKKMLEDGDEISLTVRGRGGGVRQNQKKTATAKAKSVRMETKSNEKIFMLEEIGKSIPAEFVNVPAVANTTANVRNFIETMNTSGAMVALTRLFQGLRTSNPQVFKDTLDYLKNSGSNNPSTKLNHIAPNIFGSIALVDLSEHFDKIANAPKIALNAVFEKAVSGNKTFGMGDIVKIMETTDALVVANAPVIAPVSAKASTPAPYAPVIAPVSAKASAPAPAPTDVAMDDDL